MDSIKQSLTEMTELFTSKMAEFEKNLHGAAPTSPNSNVVSSEFYEFRSFVMTSLKTLHAQVELLFKISDQQETRSRRKMLLVHGVTEERKEDTAALVAKVLADRLQKPDVVPESFSRCHRLGRGNTDKPRPIVVKFKSLPMRDHVWFSKTCFKNTGITISEYLTKARHDTFMAARKKFGIPRCWTLEGSIIIRTSDGVRHRVVSSEDLDLIACDSTELSAATSNNTKDTKGTTGSRTRRPKK
ncbi:uncharacterized protein LOC123693609 [Colias croceus]|uniref:uncharacterized protein LOC123693609 n=1 Tax=Colias crocea TaxID=72248 RepID=UPI001E27EBB6|nr:uncharacterized protein LOC123693609 [Colias croceus]